MPTVFAKTVHDRWVGTGIAVAVVALFLVYGMAVYQQVDLSLYTQMPAVMRELFGIPARADTGSLAYGAIYAVAGGLTVASLAISMGSASIAGEERDGTIGLLLANPVSRTQVLAAKAEAMVALTGIGTVTLWAAGVVVPRLLDVDVTGMHLGALMVHMFANTVFYGFLALAVGAWTGDRTIATASAATIMVVSYLLVGILPLVEGLADLARFLPWYYYDSSQPLSNGIHWGHVGLLLACATLFLGAAVVGVNRRDLTDRRSATTLVDRLRANPRTRAVIERFAGSTRVSNLWVKAASEHQGVAVVASLVVASTAIMVGPIYPLIDDQLKSFAAQLPTALRAMIGQADLGTVAGWYQTEVFSLTAPAALIAVTAVIGARGLAGEEANRTIELLLANPISRTRVVVEKAVALVLHAVVVGAVVFVSTVLGAWWGGLDLPPDHVAAATVLATLLGVVFGSAALALSAAFGKVRVAAYGTSVAALGCYLLNSFAPLGETAAGFARISPFHYYLTNDPLGGGSVWGDAAILGAVALVLIGAAIPLYGRRDLRLGG